MRSNRAMDDGRRDLFTAAIRDMLGHGVKIIVRMGLVVVLAASTGALVGPPRAHAGDCNTDIGSLMKRRQGVIDQLNKLAKAAPHGQLDPIASCPKLRDLASIERQLASYLTKNKDWCMVPDSAVEGITSSAKHSAQLAGRACRVAEQIKKGQEAIGTGPKLPTGPL